MPTAPLARTQTPANRFAYTGSPFAGIPWALSGCGLIATSFLFSRLLGQRGHYSAIEINFYRSSIVCILLMIYVLTHKKSLATSRFKEHWLRATTGWLGAILQTYALNSTVPMPIIQMLSYTNPIFFVLILAFWYKQKVMPKIWMGVILGFTGAAILLRPSGFNGPHSFIYLMAAFGSGFLTALTYLNIQKLSAAGEPSWRIVFYYSLFSIAYNIIGSSITHQHFIGIHSLLHAEWVTGLGLFILFGQLCYTQAYAQGNVSITSVFSYSHILYATLFSLIIFHQSLDTLSMLGIVVIIFGGLITRGIKHQHKE